jgi:hypothetical protein
MFVTSAASAVRLPSTSSVVCPSLIPSVTCTGFKRFSS